MLTLEIPVPGKVHSNAVASVPAHSLILRFGRSQPAAVLWLKLHQDKPELAGNILYFQTAF